MPASRIEIDEMSVVQCERYRRRMACQRATFQDILRADYSTTRAAFFRLDIQPSSRWSRCTCWMIRRLLRADRRGADIGAENMSRRYIEHGGRSSSYEHLFAGGIYVHAGLLPCLHSRRTARCPLPRCRASRSAEQQSPYCTVEFVAELR